MDRFRFDFSKIYDPYPKQRAFHACAAPYSFLGGAAGPGKTLCEIVEQMVVCNEFSDSLQAKQVHTLLLRRTHPKLEATVITRFREKIPKELYRNYNEAKKVVEWLNGATTHFGSMQYEANAWDFQGQWLHIGYDELCEFTFKQWMATSAWNRCPVSPHTRKYGSGNPIGVGAPWVKKLFVDHVPCDEMDDSQRLSYRPQDYAYFPCTYLDNPVFANDPVFLANLETYPAAIRDALKLGTWGIAGGYFSGAWDPAINIYSKRDYSFQPWDKRWISLDWGFEHWAAIYWHYMDQSGVIRTYREKCVKHQPPEVLAETIAKESLEDLELYASSIGYSDLRNKPCYQGLVLSHDAFSSRETATMGGNANSVAYRMEPTLRSYGLPSPTISTRDKLGREQLMYQLMVKRIKTREDADGRGIEQAGWQIEEGCKMLIDVIPTAPRKEDDPEKIEEFLGDDPLQGAGYGLYAIAGKPRALPKEEIDRRKIAAAPDEFSRRLVQFKVTKERDALLARESERRPAHWDN